MKKIIYTLLVLLSISLTTYAQKETSWWYFGYKAGLNFNSLQSVTAADGSVVTGMPKPIEGPIDTSEGCFTLSTSNGDLLFSSDGRFVYDKNNNIMPNGTGLLGNPSATQSGIVIPKPGSLTQYYIVTVPAEVDGVGINYSLVDLSLNGGLGDVVVASKNTTILSGAVYENIAAVPNANGKDYWLIHRTEKTFYVFAITATGISSTPNQAITEPSIDTSIYYSFAGELVLSSDYTRIVNVTYSGNQVISANFDPVLGKISDIQAIDRPGTLYGVAFSPNNEHIYITTGYNYPKVFHTTWSDLRAGIQPPIMPNGDGVTNLSLGMDGRLYGIRTIRTEAEHKDIYVVMNPDNGGTDIRHFPNYLLNSAYLGLPTFASGFIKIIPKETPFGCTSYDRTYTIEVDLSGGNAPARLEWDFGDGTPIVNQTVNPLQSDQQILHKYSNSGKYTITVTPYKGDGTKLEEVLMGANIIDCTLKTNKMTRSELLNSRELLK